MVTRAKLGVSLFDSFLYNEITVGVESVCSDSSLSDALSDQKEVNQEVNAEEVLKKYKIRLYGSKSLIGKEEKIIANLPLTGHEAKDRIIISDAIDANKLKCSVLYDGNTVYGYEKLVKELKRMKKSNSIENMTDAMYKFLSLNFDIAHYDKNGYIATYNGKYTEMLIGTEHGRNRIPGWESDVARIAENF